MGELRVMLDTPRRKLESPGASKWFWPKIMWAHGERLLGDKVWMDPAGRCIMLKPRQLDGYLDGRLRKENFTYSHDPSGGHWVEVKDKADGDDWYLLSDGTNEIVETKTTWPANQAFWVSWYVYGEANYTFSALRVRFGQYCLEIQSDGLTKLYNSDWKELGQGYITQNRRHITRRRVDLMIMPYARRRILFYTNEGWWVWTDPNGSDQYSESGYQITDGAKAAFQMLAGKGYAQLMPVTYYTSGDWLSGSYQFVRAPELSQAPEVEEFWDVPSGCGASVIMKEEDGETNFTPDGMQSLIRLRFALIGDGAKTPLVYAARVHYEPIWGQVGTSPADVTDDMMELGLRIGEDLNEQSLTLRLRNPEDYEAWKANPRIVQVYINDNEIWRGITESARMDIKPDPAAQIGELTARNFYLVRAQQARLEDQEIQLGGMGHVAAMEGLARYAGVEDSEMHFDADSTELPKVEATEPKGQDRGAWVTQGWDTAWDWMDKLQREFAADWILDAAPHNQLFCLRYRDRQSLSVEPVAILYPDASIEPVLWEKWIRDMELSRVPPEANEILIIGCGTDGKRIAAVYADRKSQNPDIPPGERPGNWLGTRLMAVFESDDLRSMDACKYLCRRVAREITKPLDCVAFEAEWRFPLWVQDVVRLYGYGDYRITAMDIRFVLETDELIMRPTQYEGVLVEQAQ